MSKVHRKLYVLITCMLFTQLVFSQKYDDLAKMSLEELLNVKVVTASKIEQNIKDVPGVVTVITKEEIERMGARTLTDILLTVPGFNRIQDSNEHIMVARGMVYATTNQKIVLLRDGHRLNEFLFENFEPDYSISLENVKRIEIVRGQGASLYGNAATGGVINLITEDKDIKKIKVKVGNYMQIHADAVYSKRFNDSTHLLVFGHYANTGGQIFKLTKEQDYLPDSVASAGEAIIDQFPHNIDFGFKLKDKSFTYSASIRHSNYTPPKSNAGYNIFQDSLFHRMQQKFNYAYADILYEKSLLDDEIHLTFRNYIDYSDLVGWQMVATPLQYEPYGKIFKIAWRGYRAGINYFGVYGYKKGNILLGTQLERSELLDSYFLSNFSDPNIVSHSAVPLLPASAENNYAAYIQHQHSFNKMLLLNSGLRFDYYTAFGSSLNPRIALIFRPLDSLSAKFIYAKSFQAPGYFYRESNPNLGTGSTELLEPEIMNSLQLVLNYNFKSKWITELTCFQNKISNMIGRDASVSPNIYTNSGKHSVRGVELESKVVIKRLSIFGNYTYMEPVKERMDDKSIERFIVNGKLRHVPQHTYNIGLNYFISKNISTNVYLNGTSDFISSSPTNPNYKIDAKYLINSTILIKNLIQRVHFSISVHNLLNHEYLLGGTTAPTPQAGRWFLISATFAMR